MANPLDPVMEWRQTALDSFKVTKRVLDQAIPRVVTDRNIFSKMNASESAQYLQTAALELDRLVVLALTAIFERTLRDSLIQVPRSAFPPGDPHRDAVREEIVKDIEFWNISSRVVEVFPAVDPVVRGQAKQVIDYRNWVAHGHTLARRAPSNVIPAEAYQRLTDFLVQAGIVIR
jgi:hypothetical protein